MRIKLVGTFLGKLAVIVGISMLCPLIMAIWQNDYAAIPFATSVSIALLTGAVLLYACRREQSGGIRQREGFAIVCFGWLLASALGGLPFLFSGSLPTFIDAFFETASGFTTTGATVYTDVEVLPQSLLLWRGLTYWLGGLGIVVLFVALLSTGPGGSGSSGVLLRAEYSGGRLATRISARTSDNARALWLTYLGLSLALFVLLCLGGMDVFDSLIHTFTAMATGGASSKNANIGYYADSPYLQWVLAIFMLFAGINLSLYFLSVVQRRNYFWKSEECRNYILLCVGAALLVFIDLYAKQVYPGESIEFYLRHSFFQVVSIITTTGYSTVDFALWPPFCTFLLFILMFAGGCQGSTAGSIKIGRWTMLIKGAGAELSTMLHPKAVRRVRLDHQPVSHETLTKVLQFFLLYMLVFFCSSLVLCAMDIPLLESTTAVAACLGNVGPGLGIIGPMGNYAVLPQAAKALLAVLMIVGRLEIYTVLVLLLPATWKK